MLPSVDTFKSHADHAVAPSMVIMHHDILQCLKK